MMDSKVIENFNDSLDSYLSIIKTHIENFKEQFKDENFKKLLDEWTLEHHIELGFNVFELISKTFYRENFHSYILKGILEFEEDGQQIFIKSFTEFLKNNPQNKYKDENFQEIDPSNFYGKNIVEREVGRRKVGRIDILIKNLDSNSIIIIENKINNAHDTEKQLLKYYNYWAKDEQGFENIYIVYLPLNEDKIPDTDDWDKEDREKVHSRLYILPADISSTSNEDNKSDLCTWLQNSITLTNNIDVISTIKQYIKLVKFLKGDIMDNHLMKSFYETIKEKKYSHSSLKSYLEILENLPSYRAKYLKEELEKKHLEPFKEIKIWDGEKKEKKFAVVLDDFLYTDTNLKTYHFAIDIWINPDSTLPSLSIFARDEEPKEWTPIIEECIKNHATKTIKKLLYFNTKWNRFMYKESNQPNGEIYSEESDEYILEEIVPPILEMLKGLAATSQKE